MRARDCRAVVRQLRTGMPKQQSIKSVVAKCKSLCKSRASPKVARDYSRYFKGVIRIHGLKAPAVDQIYKEVHGSAKISDWDVDKIFSTGLELLAGDFQEEKRLGVLFLKAKGKELGIDRVDDIAEAIDAHVYDWATCDILAGGVLRRMIESDAAIVPKLIEWSEAEHLWRRRASCVAFLSFASKGLHSDAIETICHRSAKMNERFVQLGVGWLLREFGCHDRERTVSFVKSHTEWMSREGLRYALEKMPMDLRKELMDYHKEENAKQKSKSKS